VASIPALSYLFWSSSWAILAGAALGRRLKRRFQSSQPYRRTALDPLEASRSEIRYLIFVIDRANTMGRYAIDASSNRLAC
jgi:hypothetical protein